MNMKLVAQMTIYGQEAIKVLTTVNNIDLVASSMRTIVGVGKPFLIYNSLPAADRSLVTADFTDAPIISENIAENKAAIQMQLANPDLTKLTFAE